MCVSALLFLFFVFVPSSRVTLAFVQQDKRAKLGTSMETTGGGSGVREFCLHETAAVNTSWQQRAAAVIGQQKQATVG